MSGVGNMCTPRVNGMITSNGSTRDVSVGEERKKWGGGEGCEGCPRKNRKFRRVVEIGGVARRGGWGGREGKGLG